MLKKTLSLGAVAIMLMVASCKKDKATVIKVNVASSGQALSTVGIELLSDEHRSSLDYAAAATTNSAGTIDFMAIPGKIYYIYVGNNYSLTNTDATFIVTGKFTTQQQIDYSPAQTPPAQIGDNIEMDINGDGVVNASDKVIKVTAPSQGNTVTVDLDVNKMN